MEASCCCFCGGGISSLALQSSCRLSLSLRTKTRPHNLTPNYNLISSSFGGGRSLPSSLAATNCGDNRLYSDTLLLLLSSTFRLSRYQNHRNCNSFIINTITSKRTSHHNNNSSCGGNSRNDNLRATATATTARSAVQSADKNSSNAKQQQKHQHSNGNPLGRKELGKGVVRWIGQGMKAMASDFAAAEAEGEFSELRQRMGPGLTFVIQAQPYLNAVPMPPGLEAICLKACTHYPTLFDHFQRELRDVILHLQRNKTLVVDDWRQTQSWMLLKELANSGSLSFSFLYPYPYYIL